MSISRFNLQMYLQILIVRLIAIYYRKLQLVENILDYLFYFFIPIDSTLKCKPDHLNQFYYLKK